MHQFQLRPCPECGDMEPVVYAEGNAKKVFNKDGSEDFFFTDRPGYMCECQECGVSTGLYGIASEAIAAWNTGCIREEFEMSRFTEEEQKILQEVFEANSKLIDESVIDKFNAIPLINPMTSKQLQQALSRSNNDE